jgi:hypothetical protein
MTIFFATGNISFAEKTVGEAAAIFAIATGELEYTTCVMQKAVVNCVPNLV